MKYKLFVLAFVATLFGTIIYGSIDFSYLSGVRKELFPPQKTTKRTEGMERSAQDWTALFLRKKYNPPANSRYVMLPRVGKKEPLRDSYDGSGRQCDKFRIRFNVGNEIVTITQTSCLFSVQVDVFVK